MNSLPKQLTIGDTTSRPKEPSEKNYSALRRIEEVLLNAWTYRIEEDCGCHACHEVLAEIQKLLKAEGGK